MNFHIKDILTNDLTVCADKSHPIIAARLQKDAE